MSGNEEGRETTKEDLDGLATAPEAEALASLATDNRTLRYDSLAASTLSNKDNAIGVAEGRNGSASSAQISKGIPARRKEKRQRS